MKTDFGETAPFLVKKLHLVPVRAENRVREARFALLRTASFFSLSFRLVLGVRIVKIADREICDWPSIGDNKTFIGPLCR